MIIHKLYFKIWVLVEQINYTLGAKGECLVVCNGNEFGHCFKLDFSFFYFAENDQN